MMKCIPPGYAKMNCSCDSWPPYGVRMREQIWLFSPNLDFDFPVP